MAVSVLQERSILLSLLDSLFILGIVFVVIGAFLYIIQGGFFNGIIYSLKRFRSSTKQGKFISQFDDLDETKEVHEEFEIKRSFALTRPFLFIGGFALILSFVLTYLLYT